VIPRPLAPSGHRLLALLGAGIVAVAACGGTTPTSTSAPSTPLATEAPGPTASPIPQILPGQPDETGLPTGWAYADLDGVPAPSDLAHRLPVAIMVDDNKAARPQSGFSSASIVYQAPADGGEDRYMLVFQEGTSLDIGPVRSARPYYVYWAAEYKAIFGHYGGDNQSLYEVIPAMSGAIYNMDALGGKSCPYHRISSRPMPHNAYTNSAAQISCAAKYGYPAAYQGAALRPFTQDTAPTQRPQTQTITVPYPTGTVVYEFDPAKDAYRRSVGGHPQIDQANSQPVYARNIIVMFQAVSYYSEPGHNSRPVVANVGKGKAIIFKEGLAVVGTWEKAANGAVTRFYDGSGKEVTLVRGQIFIQAVPTTMKVTYA
jgi:hypothetical protein